MAAFLAATLTAVPITFVAAASFSFTNSGGNDVVNVIHSANMTNFYFNDSSFGRMTLWNVVGDGGHDNFSLFNSFNASDTWVVLGGGNDHFNVTTGVGTGNSTYSLITRDNSTFGISLTGNGTLRFALTGGRNTIVNATESGAGGNGTEIWNVNLGSNSTIDLPRLSGNDTINVVF